jgi:formylmethanofuran dehydrogenase subunit D
VTEAAAPRLEPLPRERWDDDVRAALTSAFSDQVVQRFLSTGPDAVPVPSAITTMLHHPALAGPWLTFNNVLLWSPRSSTARASELMVLCVAWRTRSRRQPRHLNSQFDYLGEVAEVVLHPDDETAAGAVDGQEVVVRSAHGELVGIAKVDASIRRGAVSVPHGHQGANVNRLTGKDEIDVVTGMARYSGVPVTVHPVSAGSR